MKRINLAGVITGIMILLSCNTKTDIALNPGGEPVNLVERGEYLVSIMGCNDCHTPRKMTEHGPAFDTDRLLGGHPAGMPLAPYDSNTTKGWVLFNMPGTAMVGPWGTSFAANLSSDETGIGTWSEEQFKKALKEGKLKGLDGSRTLLPPMPWENYKQIEDVDVKAIFAYLKSTKPVNNIVPRPLPPGGQQKVTLAGS